MKNVMAPYLGFYENRYYSGTPTTGALHHVSSKVRRKAATYTRHDIGIVRNECGVNSATINRPRGTLGDPSPGVSARMRAKDTQRSLMLFFVSFFFAWKRILAQ